MPVRRQQWTVLHRQAFFLEHKIDWLVMEIQPEEIQPGGIQPEGMARAAHGAQGLSICCHTDSLESERRTPSRPYEGGRPLGPMSTRRCIDLYQQTSSPKESSCHPYPELWRNPLKGSIFVPI